MKLLFFLAFLPIVFVSSPSQSGWLDKLIGYDNYEDCILTELDGVQSNSAAAAIKQACRKKFPLKEKTYTRVGQLLAKDFFWFDDRQVRFTVINDQDVIVSKLLVYLGGSPCKTDDELIPVNDHFIDLKPNSKTQLYLFPYNHLPRKKGKFCMRVEGFSLD